MKMKARLSWGTCDQCGGDLPLIDGDNDSPLLPQRLRHGGDCRGYVAADNICGAYAGWGHSRIVKYVRRHGGTE